MGLAVITVNGFFGEQEITEDKFIEVWTKHVAELHRLDYSPEWTNQVHEIRDIVEAKAKDEFARYFERQHGTALADYRGDDDYEDA